MKHELLPLTLNYLNIGELTQFITEVNNQLANIAATDPLYPFAVRFKRETNGIVDFLTTDRNSPLTKSMEEADKLRESAATAITQMTDAIMRMPTLPNYEAAGRVANFMAQNAKMLYKLDEVEETALISSVVQKAESDAALMKDLTDVGCQPMFAQLKASNISYNEYLAQRAKENAEKSGKYVSAHRKEVIASYRKIESAINLFAADDLDGIYTQLIGSINSRITHYQTLADGHKAKPVEVAKPV